jgi:chaperonin GroES
VKARYAQEQALTITQYGGSPLKVGEEEYSLFRDHEYVHSPFQIFLFISNHFHSRLLAKINE